MKYLPPGIQPSTSGWNEGERCEFLSALKVGSLAVGLSVELSSEGEMGAVFASHAGQNGKRGGEWRESNEK